MKDAATVDGDYEKFGEFVGKLLKFASEEEETLKPQLAQTEPEENSKLVVAEIALGLYKAMKVGTFNFTALLDCIYFADQDAIVLYEMGKEIEEHWKDLDLTDLFIAACGAAVLYGQFQETLQYCEAVDPSKLNWTEMNKITELAKNKDNIKVVGENMIFNGVTITNEFMLAMKSWDARNFNDFGFQLGNALMLATQTQDNNMFLY